MKESESLFDTMAASVAPVHPDGHKFVAAFAVIALLLFWVAQPLGWLGFIATGWCAYFFRDPERVTPLREGLVIAPADGKVTAIEEVVPPPELGLDSAPRTRISIFLSVFDVHIARAPVPGRVAKAEYVPGLFLNAALDKASEDNERQCLTFEAAGGARIGCVLIAGLVARRIVTFTAEGATVEAGERIGLIRFGSRADIYLPPGKAPLVAVGQRSVAGETVLADLSSGEGVRQARAS
ncbi:MAG: phosphatidylserine decarboxylase [Pseudomonadota bacterium]|nr:phosphatidylserine decarboxylase [Pseudomonadota bacterium]